MSRQQKLIIAILSGAAVLVLAALGCAAFLLLASRPGQPAAARPAPAATAVELATVVASSPAPPAPTATATPTATAPPSPTSTRVVTITVEPTPPPPSLNCINNITDFEASGLITNEQVQDYLRQAVPAAHLDNCRVIRYIPRQVDVYSTPAAGKFIPLFRHISVYAAPPEYHNLEELLNTLVHEVGHNAYFNMRLENEDRAKRWIELHRQSQVIFLTEGRGFVSAYARTDELEDFAESYLAYVRQPAALRQASPEKYEFLRLELFAGREY